MKGRKPTYFHTKGRKLENLLTSQNSCVQLLSQIKASSYILALAECLDQYIRRAG